MALDPASPGPVPTASAGASPTASPKNTVPAGTHGGILVEDGATDDTREAGFGRDELADDRPGRVADGKADIGFLDPKAVGNLECVRRFAGLRLVPSNCASVDCLERRIGAAVISDKRMFLMFAIMHFDGLPRLPVAVAHGNLTVTIRTTNRAVDPVSRVKTVPGPPVAGSRDNRGEGR